VGAAKLCVAITSGLEVCGGFMVKGVLSDVYPRSSAGTVPFRCSLVVTSFVSS
jgi:hypothetical protein